MESVDAARAARAAAVAYFGTALAVTWSRPVLGGCARDRLPARFGANPLVVAFPMRRPRARGRRFPARLRQTNIPPPMTDPLSRHRAASCSAPAWCSARRRSSSRSPCGRDRSHRGSTDPSRGDSLGPDLDTVPPERPTGDAAHRGWLVLVSASAARPRRNPAAASARYATLANGVGPASPPATKSLDITADQPRGVRGAPVRRPGRRRRRTRALLAHRTFDGVKKKTARVRRSDGGSAFQSSSPTRAAMLRAIASYGCYALSDAAREAWTVALHPRRPADRAAMMSPRCSPPPPPRREEGVDAARCRGGDGEQRRPGPSGIVDWRRKPRRVEGAR